MISRTQKDALDAYIRDRFTVEWFDPRYLILDTLNIKNIFATNVDDLPYQIYASSRSHYLNDLDSKGPSFNDKDAIDIVTLHGCVIDTVRPLVFSPYDIAASFRTDPDRWHSLTAALQKYPTLFWGYRVEDSDTLEALSPQTIQGRDHQDKWIVLRHGTDEGSLAYFRSLGFKTIFADTSDLLSYLGSPAITPPLGSTPHRRAPTSLLFPNETIPALGSVPARPVIDL